MNALQVAERSAAYALEDAVAPVTSEAFDLFATAPQGVAKLRELILSLAVRGRLVPQIASEGSAATLVEQIEKEHTRLIARGDTKRSKPLPRVATGEPPFEIPRGWVWVRLGLVTNFGSTDKAVQVMDDTWVLDLEDIEKDTSKLLRRVRFAERRSLSAKNRFRQGDVLYGKLRPYLNKVIVADQAGVCTTEILPFRCFGQHDPRYFRLALQSAYFLTYVNSKSYGMKMPRLGTDDGRAALVPLPPFAEQRRIVARVEELMGLCDQLEAHGRLQDEQHARLVATLFDALVASASPKELAGNWQRVASHFDLLLDRPAAVDALEQTILQLAVRGLLVPQDPTDEPASHFCARIRSQKSQLLKHHRINLEKPRSPIDIDEIPFRPRAGWSWERFGELVNISSGVTLGRKSTPSKPVTLPYLRVANVQRWYVTIDHLKMITVDESELPRFLLETGDLLLTEGGDWDKVGRTCIWQGEVDHCLHQNHVFKARGVVLGWLPAWAELFLNSLDARNYFADASKQTTNLASINSTQLKNCPFPVPPLAEQRRIVARVDELRALCARLRQHLQRAQAMQSNLADALVSTVARNRASTFA